MRNDRKSLVLVLGAGASNEVGLPVGTGLKREIADLLDIRYDEYGRFSHGSREIESAIKRLSHGRDVQCLHKELLPACRQIRNAMPQAISIDNFIDCRADNPNIAACGKIAIARAILNAEASSQIFVPRTNINNRIDFEPTSGTWFNKFFQLLSENTRLSDLAARLQKTAIISFNYDRCIEHYLYYAIQNYYGVGGQESAEALRNLDIFHPYGQIGCLPWMNGPTEIDFGGTVTQEILVTAAQGIRTFTEGTSPQYSEIGRIRDAARNTDRLIFLGFAFHPLNLSLLFNAAPCDMAVPAPKLIFGTAYGISGSNCNRTTWRLCQDLNTIESNVILRNDLKCAQMIDEYRLDIAFG